MAKNGFVVEITFNMWRRSYFNMWRSYFNMHKKYPENSFDEFANPRKNLTKLIFQQKKYIQKTLRNSMLSFVIIRHQPSHNRPEVVLQQVRKSKVVHTVNWHWQQYPQWILSYCSCITATEFLNRLHFSVSFSFIKAVLGLFRFLNIFWTL